MFSDLKVEKNVLTDDDEPSSKGETYLVHERETVDEFVRDYRKTETLGNGER